MNANSTQQPTKPSQLEDSDYSPSEQESTQTNSQLNSNSSTDSHTSKDEKVDREAELLAEIKRFQERRHGTTKDTPRNEAQVDGWCKKNINQLEELLQQISGVGTLLNLLAPETLDEYGQRLIVDATTVWLARTNND